MAQTWKDLILLVKQMRDAQKEYFRTRSKDSLATSKNLEQMVDEIVDRGIKYYNSLERLDATARVFENNGFERIEQC